MVATPVEPHDKQLVFPQLPHALRAEVSGVDAPEIPTASLDDPSESECSVPDMEDFDVLDGETVSAAAKGASTMATVALQSIDSRHMSVLQAELKLAAGQSAAMDALEDSAVDAKFAKFAQHTLEPVGGQRLHVSSESLLWGFSDADPLVAAQRAAAAAMELLGALELFNFQQGGEFQLHLGLSTGQVQFEAVGGMELALTSSLVLVQKITALTPSGGIYLCQNTVDCLDGAQRCELVGQVAPGDGDETVAVHQLQADDVSAEAEPIARCPLIGRESELEKFEALLEQVLASEQAQCAVLSGSAGIGKTHLLETLQQRAGENRAEAYWLNVANANHAPMTALLQSMALQLAANRHPGLVLEEVQQRVAEELMLSEPEQVLYAQLLGQAELSAANDVAVDAQCDMIARLLNHRRSAPGTLIVVEDIHWASEATMAMLALLCDRLAQTASLLVFSSRDCYQHKSFALHSDISVELMSLGGLSTASAFELAGYYLPSYSAVVRHCVARAAGSPLFLTQQLQATIDTIDTRSPGSLRSIVKAKTDSLDARALAQLQAAAVLGNRLTLGAWSGVLGELPDSCDTLVQRQLLREDASGYAFCHDLIHSVVYRAIDKLVLQQLHLQAAQYYEHNAAMAAWHYLKAGEPLSGVTQLLQAGAEAMQLGELDRAAQLLDALADVDEAQLTRLQRYRLHRLRADCHSRRASLQPALHSYEQALLVAEDGAERSETQLLLAACRGEAGETAAAMTLLGEVLAEARRAELAALEARALQLRATLLFRGGRYVEAESDLRAGLEQVRVGGETQREIELAQTLGELLCRQGSVREAEQLLAQAHQQRERQRHGSGWAERDPWLGQCLYFMGDVCGARDILQGAVEHAKAVGDQRGVLLARCLLGPVLLDLGEPASALANGKLAMAIVGETEQEPLASMAMVAVGEAHIRLGKYALGLQMLTQAWTRAESSDAKYSTGPWALAALATVVQRDVEQRNLLAKGEHLLHSGAEGLSHFWFYRLAIQVALGGGDERLARRYAKLLSVFEKQQELPWVKQACAGLIEDSGSHVLVAPLD